MLKSYQIEQEDVIAAEITEGNIDYVADWCNGRAYATAKPYKIVFEVNNGENIAFALVGDYLVKGEDREFFSMTPNRFNSTYKVKE